MTDADERCGTGKESDGSAGDAQYQVGYKRPPQHSRFKPGVSGNPSGRRKGSPNLKTLFDKILAEEISLREGQTVRKVSKAEAVIRGLIVGALKGDQRAIGAVFKIAEGIGQFEEDKPASISTITRVIVETAIRHEPDSPLPPCNDENTE